MCEITAVQNEARQQKVSYKSNLCCLGEDLLHESGLNKSYFLKYHLFRGGHFYVSLYRTILETSPSFGSFSYRYR
ncbi:hypothetical protein DHL47_02765 [Streptococcus panodentis]|uniref:Uncharacterized protein n=1 Tax=Streptococcus panodentis TaxID=1581472 RepID=A0ABS5AVH1_9STRE|nr:hypothetical protein [Streptococcus panodentis]